MSRPVHAHLPPRCPLQKRASGHVQDAPVSPTLPRNDRFRLLHHRSYSQSSILEEHPSWLDKLLSDSDTHSRGSFHCRSASDSLALIDSSPIDETGNGLVGDCVYGPNSPRRRCNSTHQRDPIVSALSEYVAQKPLDYLSENLCISETIQSDSKGDACGSNGELDPETKFEKRHPAQRSRVRKLQYIAELERTVDVFQTLESELETRVASLLQKRVFLSVENNTLKQQIVYLQKEKLVKDGQYQTLKKEVERLTMDYINQLKRTPHSRTGSNASAVSSEASWKILDMGKLSLGGNPVTLKHGFGS